MDIVIVICENVNLLKENTLSFFSFREQNMSTVLEQSRVF
jgi:hypothetical protein